jgi:2,3-bisphosphoglycerate-dependent phosphoglycerate mutase
MTTILLLIRHGQTDYNANGRWQGHLDVPLNDIGFNQAQALAQRLAGWPVQALYSSDLQRARMTAVPLAQVWGLTPVYDPIWRERHVGVFEGRGSSELQVAYPEVWAKMRQGIIEIPEGEAYATLQARVAGAYQQLIVNHPDEMVSVVSHGGALNALVAYVLGIPQHYGRLSFHGNTGLTILRVNEHGPRLVMLNDTRHLGDGIPT